MDLHADHDFPIAGGALDQVVGMAAAMVMEARVRLDLLEVVRSDFDASKAADQRAK